MTDARTPDAEAVRYQGTSLTWEQVDALANRAATGLLESGVRPGDLSAARTDNRPEALALIYGASRAGIAFVPLSPRLTREEAPWQVRDVDAALLLSDLEGDDGIPPSAILDVGEEVAPDVEIYEESWFSVRFTSETTGRPRAVANTQRAAATLYAELATALGFRTENVAPVNAPLAQAALGFAAPHVSLSAVLVIESSFDPSTVWRVRDAHAAINVFMVPTMFALSIEEEGDGGTVSSFVSMASVFTPALKQKVVARLPGARLYDCCAGTEFGAATVLRLKHLSERPDSVGLPRLGGRVRVLDDGGCEVPSGQIGQVYLQGPTLFDCYVGMDEHGFLYIAYRRADVIISGGHNIYPAEIEDVPQRAPGVVEVAVVGVSDETWGQIVTAVVVGDAEPAQLDRPCRTRLAAYKVPRRYKFVAELPTSAAGRIQRRMLRSTLEADGRRGKQT